MLNKIIKNKTLQTTSIDRSQNINVKIVKEVAQVATSSKIYALTNPTTTTSSASAVHAYTHYDRTNAVGCGSMEDALIGFGTVVSTVVTASLVVSENTSAASLVVASGTVSATSLMMAA
jgi:hypothetical protein